MVRRHIKRARRKIKRARLKLDSVISSFLPHAVVLIYHRVTYLDSDPHRLSVTPENFDKHMELISRKFQPISLRELVDDLAANGRVRDRAVVVTFDDGYEDNYLYASPILEKYAVPATIFVSSGYTGSNREFWWDELERLLLNNETLPEEIHASLNGGVYRRIVSSNAHPACQELAPGADASEAEQRCASPLEIHRELCTRFQTLAPHQIDRALAELRELTGDDGTARPNNLPMDTEQLSSIHRGGLIEIGAHTRSHINLAAQSAEQQFDEIQGSKTDLEDILGARVESFSYPFGTIGHYSPWTIECVQNAGFRSALANFSGIVSRLSNQYEIPRCLIRDWDKKTFKDKMNRYYAGTRQVAAHGKR